MLAPTKTAANGRSACYGQSPVLATRWLYCALRARILDRFVARKRRLPSSPRLTTRSFPPLSSYPLTSQSSRFDVMRPAPGSNAGPSRSAKTAQSKGERKAPKAAPAAPPTAPDFDDESSAGDDDDDDSEGGAELPELEDDEEDEFEEDRQRTTGVAMWEDDEGEYDGSSVDGGEASELDEDEEEDDDDNDDGDEAPRLSASAKGKGWDREMVSVILAFELPVRGGLTIRPRSTAGSHPGG